MRALRSAANFSARATSKRVGRGRWEPTKWNIKWIQNSQVESKSKSNQTKPNKRIERAIFKQKKPLIAKTFVDKINRASFEVEKSVEKRYKFLKKFFKNIYNFFQVFFEHPFFVIFPNIYEFFLVCWKTCELFWFELFAAANNTEVSFLTFVESSERETRKCCQLCFAPLRKSATLPTLLRLKHENNLRRGDATCSTRFIHFIHLLHSQCILRVLLHLLSTISSRGSAAWRIKEGDKKGRGRGRGKLAPICHS